MIKFYDVNTYKRVFPNRPVRFDKQFGCTVIGEYNYREV